MAADELTGAITQRIWLRLQSFAMQIVIDIADQRFHRGITPLRRFLHRGQAEDIEIRHAAGLLRLSLRNHDFGFPRCAVREIEGQPAAQEFVEDNAQRVDVRIDADAFATNLLRRGVRGSHQPQGGPRLIGRSLETIQLFGDSEIQQPHAAVRAN